MIQSPAFELTAEPCGEVYEALLEYACRCCEKISFVWQTQLRFEPSAEHFAEALEPYLISETRARSWPGTESHHEAVVRYYWLTPQSAYLLKTVSRLYSWLSPKLPEDLAFYTSTSDCWLATVSHEKMGLFYNETSLHELQKNVPGIVLRRETSV